MFLKDIFENTMDKKKFQYTNRIWNEARLNTGWSVGYVSDLINRNHFRTKEEWKEFYYNSGEERGKRIAEMNLTEDQKNKLYRANVAHSLPQEIKDLNYKYGRTRESLIHKGRLLYQAVLKDGNKLNLTEKECVYAVMFRVLGETWNGIVIREQNTVKNLNKSLTDMGYSVDIRKTEGSFDYKYEVDFEVFVGDKLICGIQVKPESYRRGETKELIVTKQINKVKNDKYEEEFGKRVYYVYSKTDGTILNSEVINDIIRDTEICTEICG